MTKFYYYDAGFPKAPEAIENHSQRDRGLNYTGVIEGSSIGRCIEIIDNIIGVYGSGVVNDGSDEIPPRIRVAELALGAYEVEGVHPRVLPYVHFEMPTEESVDSEQWLATALFYYGDKELTHCITWLRNNTVKVTRYGSEAGNEFLTNETAQGLASDLEALSNELNNSYFAILEPFES